MPEIRHSLVRRWIGVAALTLAIACGGGGKKDKTTPGGGGSGSGSGDQSMTDKDPNGGVATGGGPTGGGNTGGGPTGPTGSGGPTVTPDPPFTPPNYDPDPATIKTQVDQQIAAAKAALAQPTPDADGALRAAKAALALDASSVEAASYVAFAYYHKKLYDTAELVLDDVFKRPAALTNANMYYVLGLVYDKTNRPEKAMVNFAEAVRLDPKHASALTNLGVHQLMNSQYPAAQTTFERLTKEFNRNDAITLTSLGSAYRGHAADFPPGAPQRDQNIQSAEGAYKRALSANSNYGPAYYNLGLLYIDNDPYPGIADPIVRLTTAKNYFDQYKNMPGFDVKLYDSRTKDVDKAIKRAQKKAKKPPAPAPAAAPPKKP